MLSNVVDVDSIINDALGTTVGSWEGRASSRPESGLKYSAAALTAFGEDLTATSAGGSSRSPFPVARSPFFTGKPYVEGLGHAFLMRNYRAGLAKWQTADPMGYPDGWNQLKYGVNSPSAGIDLFGAVWGNSDFVDFYFDQDPNRLNDIDTDQMGLTDAVLSVVRGAATGSIDSLVERYISFDGKTSGSA